MATFSDMIFIDDAGLIAPAPSAASGLAEEQVREAAKVLAISPLIESPKGLSADSWMGLARHVLTAALRSHQAPVGEDYPRMALEIIAQWDCLNPPRPDLLSDLPWLKRLVDRALAGQDPRIETPSPAGPDALAEELVRWLDQQALLSSTNEGDVWITADEYLGRNVRRRLTDIRAALRSRPAQGRDAVIEAAMKAVDEWPASSNTDNPHFEKAMALLERAVVAYESPSPQTGDRDG